MVEIILTLRSDPALNQTMIDMHFRGEAGDGNELWYAGQLYDILRLSLEEAVHRNPARKQKGVSGKISVR